MNNAVNRTQSAILNIFSGSILSVVSLVISFLNRVIFLHYLNAEYLGVSGLFSNILLIFSLVELGVGAALTQMFYKPFAQGDYEQLSKVTYTTKVILNSVGIIIVIMSFAFTPCLQFFVNDMNAVPHMRLIFFLYGISSSVTYFLGFYRTIITANQQAYKIVKIDAVWKFVMMVGQWLALAITKNFVVYLVVQISLNFLVNVVIKAYVKKQVPDIDYKCKKFVSKSEIKNLFKNVTGLAMNRIATVVTNGTDNIVISKFLNLVTVGLASNYVMLTQAVTTLVESIFGPLLASIGNLCTTESDEVKEKYFYRFSFAAFWLYGFCSICAFILAKPFIVLVFGEKYSIPIAAIFFLSFDIFCVGLTRVATLFKTAQGLFWYGKYRPLIQALLNLIISIILVKITHELWAVYAGTVLSRLLITIWYEPYVVLKYGMHAKSTRYFKKLALYFVTYTTACLIMVFIDKLISLHGFLQLCVMAVVCVTLINGLFMLVFFKTKEFKYWLDFVRNILKGKLAPKK